MAFAEGLIGPGHFQIFPSPILVGAVFERFLDLDQGTVHALDDVVILEDQQSFFDQFGRIMDQISQLGLDMIQDGLKQKALLRLLILRKIGSNLFENLSPFLDKGLLVRDLLVRDTTFLFALASPLVADAFSVVGLGRTEGVSRLSRLAAAHKYELAIVVLEWSNRLKRITFSVSLAPKKNDTP